MADSYNKKSYFWNRDKKSMQSDYLCRPHAISLIKKLKNKKILDVGCGEGYLSRLMAKKGALVTGIDHSSKLIKIAMEKEQKEKLGISYFNLNMENMKEIKSDYYDTVISVLVFNCLKNNWNKAFSEIHRCLNKKGEFILALAHPFELIHQENTFWLKYKNNVKSYWQKGVIKKLLFNEKKESFEVINYQKTISYIFNSLIKKGFTIKEVIEPKPTKNQLLKSPSKWKEESKTPFYLIIRSTKY